ncbi:MAG TPA: response regulator [Acidobacteriota bacterium]|nr:response regulator [Acidobacteriota bacterium]
METKRCILIVDDDQELREFLKELLAAEDRDILTAKNLTQTYEILSNEAVDLILLDLYLPDGTGIRLLTDLSTRARVPKKKPGIIVMTAFGSWETHVRAYNLGAHYYLDKPFKVTQVRTLVDQALRQTAVQ